jgi:hypothetical protein
MAYLIKHSLVKNPPFPTTFPIPFQLYFLVENNKFVWKILFVTEIYYLQLKTLAVNKYKLKVTFQLKMLIMCEHHINYHFKPF